MEAVDSSLRLAFISDIHGNLPALEATLASIKSERVDSIICLGDIVGYGARPNECIELLIDGNIPALLGNHDAAVIGRLSRECLNNHAQIACEWTIKNLHDKGLQFLNSLPLTRNIDSIICVHSSPNEPEQWRYIFNVSDAALAFRGFSEPVCFFGHTHFPSVFTNPSDGRRLINVGSVGQPRDRDSRACYGVFDSVTANFRWVRVEYKIDSAARQIIDAGLPHFLAERLSSGI